MLLLSVGAVTIAPVRTQKDNGHCPCGCFRGLHAVPGDIVHRNSACDSRPGDRMRNGSLPEEATAGGQGAGMRRRGRVVAITVDGFRLMAASYHPMTLCVSRMGHSTMLS